MLQTSAGVESGLQVLNRFRVAVLKHCVATSRGSWLNSAAINRRSRCDSKRGWPVVSSHFSPAATPQVGQGTASICFGLSSAFMAERYCPKPMYRNGQSRTVMASTYRGVLSSLVPFLLALQGHAGLLPGRWWRRSPCTPRARECIPPSRVHSEGSRLPARFRGALAHTSPGRLAVSNGAI